MRKIVLITLLTSLSFMPAAHASALLRGVALKALANSSKDVGVPFRLLAAICSVESSLRPFIKPVQDNGSLSYGMCQVKEDTARFVGFSSKVNVLSKPEINTYYAAKYLKYQLTRYEGDWIRALAAYNAGSAHWHIANQEYVNKVLAQAVKF